MTSEEEEEVILARSHCALILCNHTASVYATRADKHNVKIVSHKVALMSRRSEIRFSQIIESFEIGCIESSSRRHVMTHLVPVTVWTHNSTRS